MRGTMIERIASVVDARRRCEAEGNVEWERRHRETIADLASCLPSGSGWDCGTIIDIDRSTGEKIILHGAFHHMDENGTYDGWTDHTITVRPSLIFGFSISVSGRDRNGIKDYISEMFSAALTEKAPD